MCVPAVFIRSPGVIALNPACFANRSYQDTPSRRGWIEDPEFNSLHKIPDGWQKYGEIPFFVCNKGEAGKPAFLYLTGTGRKMNFPSELTIDVQGIPLMRQLSLLHSSAWCSVRKAMGRIIIRYMDGTEECRDMIFGRDISDWYGGRDAENARFGYMAEAKGQVSSLNHFVSAFSLETKDLREIAFQVTDDQAMWMISAVTFSPVQLTLPPQQKIPLLALRCSPLPAAPKQGPQYRIILLGDLHFDDSSGIYHQDQDPNDFRKTKPGRFAAMWDKRNPALLQAAAKQVTPETAFVIQTGDLVNGDCFHPDGASRMLRDALREMKAAFPALPFLPVVGNHDIHGMEMAEAYAETMPPFLSSQCRQPVSGSDFYFLQGPDLFLFVNFNDPDCTVIQEAFAKHADARYRFVISHGPVIPSESYSTWMLLGTNGRMRAEMRELFLQNDVIVFSGHTHTLELEECVTDSGRMTQLIASSVWDDASLAIPEILTENPEDYGKKQQSYDGFQLLREYSSALTRYLLAHGAGFLAIDIGPSGIVAHFFGGASETPSAEIRLR